MVPDGECGPAKRCLQRQWVSRRLAPGSTCPPPGSLEEFLPTGSGAAPGDNAEAKLVFACFGCAWSTRLW